MDRLDVQLALESVLDGKLSGSDGKAVAECLVKELAKNRPFAETVAEWLVHTHPHMLDFIDKDL